jgi:DNA-binding MarR family transcriptional regulator
MSRNNSLYPGLDALGLVENACVCHVLRRTTRLTTQLYDHHLRPSGLTLAQFSLLATLHHTAPIAMTALARRMGTERTTLTRNLRVLERLCHVQVTAADDKDRRRRMVEITQAGSAALAAALPLWREAQTVVLHGLGDDGWKQLRTSLRQTAGIVQEARGA